MRLRTETEGPDLEPIVEQSQRRWAIRVSAQVGSNRHLQRTSSHMTQVKLPVEISFINLGYLELSSLYEIDKLITRSAKGPRSVSCIQQAVPRVVPD